MPGDYTTQINTAKRLITAKGIPVTFRRNTGAFNPVTGGPNGFQTEDTWTGVAVMLPRSKGPAFDAMDDAFKVALVTGKASMFLVAAKGLTHTPEPQDKIVLGDGSIWIIKGLTTLAPANTPIIHTVGAVAA